MILTVDVGNTNTVLGGFEGDSLIFTARLSTDRFGTEDEFAGKILSALTVRRISPDTVTGAIYSSVVPSLNGVVSRAVRYLFGFDPLSVGPGIKTGINIRCDVPSSVGTDIICACVGVRNLYGCPALIADFGTTTNLTVLNEQGSFIGIAICPGVKMGLDALSEKAALLPEVALEAPPAAVAKNTADSMKSGVVFGHAAMVDGMIDRICEEVGAPLPVYATGSMAALIADHCRHEMILDEHLVLKGLNLLYQKNN